MSTILHGCRGAALLAVVALATVADPYASAAGSASRAVAADGILLVGNFLPGGTANGVLRYDSAGTFLDTMVPGGSGGLVSTCCMAFGPDENLYVSDAPRGVVLRFHGLTGEFIDEFIPQGSGGLAFPLALLFHTDGYLYVGDLATGSIRRYDARSGAPVDEFVSGANEGMGQFRDPQVFQFGPDGDLYVAAQRTDRVLQYRGTTGDFVREFVAASADAIGPAGLVFGRDGLMYVGFVGSDAVRRYDVFRDPADALVDVFVPPGSGGLSGPVGLAFGFDRNLFVASVRTGEVLRYDGKTGDFQDVFVPAGRGGLAAPRLLTFKAKTKVCHKPSRVPAKARTLSVAYRSAFDHLAHGDTLGACKH
jgi:streptogramin lyase